MCRQTCLSHVGTQDSCCCRSRHSSCPLGTPHIYFPVGTPQYYPVGSHLCHLWAYTSTALWATTRPALWAHHVLPRGHTLVLLVSAHSHCPMGTHSYCPVGTHSYCLVGTHSYCPVGTPHTAPWAYLVLPRGHTLVLPRGHTLVLPRGHTLVLPCGHILILLCGKTSWAPPHSNQLTCYCILMSTFPLCVFVTSPFLSMTYATPSYRVPPWAYPGEHITLL